MLGRCPDRLPKNIERAATELARAYATSPIRPRLRVEVLQHWDRLIEEWSYCRDLPLFIRKQSSNIGDMLEHGASGRKLAPCDNSPAHWTVIKAFERGTDFTLDDAKTAIANQE